MKNVTYHLLVNLSVSDLLITCLCGPVHVINSLVMGEWVVAKFKNPPGTFKTIFFNSITFQSKTNS